MKAVAIAILGSCVWAQQRVNPDAETIKQFEKLIDSYVTMHKNLVKELPSAKPTTEPQQILDHQHALAAKIRAARAQAHQGDIFTPPIAKEFERLLGFAKQGENGPQIKKSLERAEPVRFSLHINDAYPSKVPLQSTPPTILLNLPRLPPELEYRVVGHALLLRDTAANVVVDLIPNAIP